jgi:hypothetical protein
MDPNGQQPMDLNQNPFAAIFEQAPQQAMPQAAPQTPMTGAPQAAAPQGGTAPVPEEPAGPEELMPGKTGDNTRPLLGAIQQLHNYIAASTDAGTIQLVRNLISALTQLVARDQKQSEQLSRQQAQAQGAPQAPMAQ